MFLLSDACVVCSEFDTNSSGADLAIRTSGGPSALTTNTFYAHKFDGSAPGDRYHNLDQDLCYGTAAPSTPPPPPFSPPDPPARPPPPPPLPLGPGESVSLWSTQMHQAFYLKNAAPYGGCPGDEGCDGLDQQWVDSLSALVEQASAAALAPMPTKIRVTLKLADADMNVLRTLVYEPSRLGTATYRTGGARRRAVDTAELDAKSNATTSCWSEQIESPGSRQGPTDRVYLITTYMEFGTRLENSKALDLSSYLSGAVGFGGTLDTSRTDITNDNFATYRLCAGPEFDWVSRLVGGGTSPPPPSVASGGDSVNDESALYLYVGIGIASIAAFGIACFCACSGGTARQRPPYQKRKGSSNAVKKAFYERERLIDGAAVGSQVVGRTAALGRSHGKMVGSRVRQSLLAQAREQPQRQHEKDALSFSLGASLGH